MALHALTQGIDQRLAADIEQHDARADLKVVPPLCPIRTAPADFSPRPRIRGMQRCGIYFPLPRADHQKEWPSSQEVSGSLAKAGREESCLD